MVVFDSLSRFIVIPWRDKLPVSSLYYRQKFPQIYFNVPNLKEREFTNLFILFNKPYMGCLLCCVPLL